MKEGDKFYHIVSPLSGTFYRGPSPEEPPYVEEGDKIERGQVVCIVESMKIFNEVRSDRAGIIHKILIEDEDPVLINQALIEVELK
jgi:acetyl-CoA carboxylase biotin carboxyl carrier protein